MKDTIAIGESYDRRRKLKYLSDTVPMIDKFSDAHLSIYVDTSFSLTFTLDKFNPDRSIKSDPVRHCNASAVILRNMTDTAMYMGVTYSMYYMHREMKNSHGKWVKMGKKLCEELFCATGQPYIFLQPHEVAISKVAHYGGPHAVACRLAFGWATDSVQVYSNIFTEHIHNDLLHLIENN